MEGRVNPQLQIGPRSLNLRLRTYGPRNLSLDRPDQRQRDGLELQEQVHLRGSTNATQNNSTLLTKSLPKGAATSAHLAWSL